MASESRQQLRDAALKKFRFDGGARIPTDLLLAFAPNAVDVDAIEKTLLVFRQSPRGDGRIVPIEVQSAVLIELQCYCAWERDIVIDCLDLPPMPSDLDRREALRQNKDAYSSEPGFAGAGGNLRIAIWQACSDCGWKVPSLPSPERVRTHEDVIDYVSSIETWIDQKLSTPNTVADNSGKPDANKSNGAGEQPEGMPSGELRNLMEKVILTMGERGITTMSNKVVGQRIAAILRPRQNYNSQLRKTLRQLRLPPSELLSPSSGYGYFLNSKGVAVYEQLKKDRVEKSLKKMKSH